MIWKRFRPLPFIFANDNYTLSRMRCGGSSSTWISRRQRFACPIRAGKHWGAHIQDSNQSIRYRELIPS